MRINLTCTWMLLAALLHAQTPDSAKKQTGSTSKTPASAQPAPKRVRADLSGFELDKSRVHPAMQVGGATRGNDSEPALLAPRMGRAYDLRPVFRWLQSNKANSFKFRLMNDAGAHIYEATVSGRSFRYPEGAPALNPGETYSWSVEPEFAMLGTAARPVRFTLIGNGEREEIEKELAAAGASSEKRAEVCIGHRLWYDSVESYTTLIASQPENAALYRRRAEIYEQVAATQALARSDLQKAETVKQHE